MLISLLTIIMTSFKILDSNLMEDIYVRQLPAKILVLQRYYAFIQKLNEDTLLLNKYYIYMKYPKFYKNVLKIKNVYHSADTLIIGKHVEINRTNIGVSIRIIKPTINTGKFYEGKYFNSEWLIKYDDWFIQMFGLNYFKLHNEEKMKLLDSLAEDTKRKKELEKK